MASIPETPSTKSVPISAPAISWWGAVGLGIALTFFTASALLSYANQKRFANAEALASSSRLLISKVEELSSLVQSAETTQRAYLFTEQPDFRDEFEAAVEQIHTELDRLDSLGLSAKQQSSVAKLREIAGKRLRNLNETLTVYETLGREAAQQEVATGDGHKLMSNFRQAVHTFIENENNVFNDRRRVARRNLWITHLSDLVVASIGLLLAGAAIVQLRREFQRRYAIARQLDEQRKLSQTTLLSIGDAVVTTDAQSRVRSLNAVAERLLCWPVAAAVGKPLADVFRVVGEKDRVAVADVAMRAIREGQTVRQSPNSLLIARDNTERRIEGSAAPIRTSDGRVFGAVLTFRDVTDRKRSEDALRRGEERLRRALRASRQVAWELDVRTDVVVRSENAADLLGLPPFGSMAEQFELIHPDDRPEVETALEELRRGEGDYAVEYRVTLPDGRLLWLSDKAELRRDDLSEPGVIVGMLGDITDVKRAEAELIEADHRKDRFLATLAHELRNPLAPISNVIQAWSFFKDDREEMDRMREMLSRQVTQMSRLIDDLLDVSRITRGKIKLRRERVDLKTILAAAAECVRPHVDQRRHTLWLDIPDRPLPIDGDEARLVQAFTNLLQNAVKYTDDNGTIAMTVSLDDRTGGGPDDTAAGGAATIAIRDNGAGIPREMLGRIFEMFSQVDQTLDRAHGGLGIGLTLVRTLIGMHGGRVSASSDGPGTGSTFLVTLPLAVPEPASGGTSSHDPGASESSVNEPTPDDAATAARNVANRISAGPDVKTTDAAFTQNVAAPAESHVQNGLPLKVLIVDDMRPSARTLAMMLDGIGQTTRVANDGETALAVFDDFLPDVVLLDIAMPGMDGYEVCRRLRDRSGPQPTIVALTGYTQEEDRRKAFDAGFDRHLVKPTSLDALKELLAEASSVQYETAPAD